MTAAAAVSAPQSEPPATVASESAAAEASSAGNEATPPGQASGEGRKVSTSDIQLVQNLIERCLQMYMSQREVVSTLQTQAKIEHGFTKLVWQKLEEQNPDFFRAYYTRLKLKDQIVLFNHLLEQQVLMFRKMQSGWFQPQGMVMHPRGGAAPGVVAGVPAPGEALGGDAAMLAAEGSDDARGFGALGEATDAGNAAFLGLPPGLTSLGLGIPSLAVAPAAGRGADPSGSSHDHLPGPDPGGGLGAGLGFPAAAMSSPVSGAMAFGGGADSGDLGGPLAWGDLALDQLGHELDNGALSAMLQHEPPRELPRNFSTSELALELDGDLDKP